MGQNSTDTLYGLDVLVLLWVKAVQRSWFVGFRELKGEINSDWKVDIAATYDILKERGPFFKPKLGERELTWLVFLFIIHLFGKPILTQFWKVSDATFDMRMAAIRIGAVKVDLDLCIFLVPEEVCRADLHLLPSVKSVTVNLHYFRLINRHVNRLLHPKDDEEAKFIFDLGERDAKELGLRHKVDHG